MATHLVHQSFVLPTHKAWKLLVVDSYGKPGSPSRLFLNGKGIP